MVNIMKSPLALTTLLFSSVLSVNAAGTFTPAAMLSAPRRGTALPNDAGTLAIYSTNTWNFTTHSRTYGTYVMDLSDGSTTLFTNSSAASDINWLSGNTIVWFSGEDDGTTTVYVGDATKPKAKPITAGTVPGPVNGLKVAELGNGTYAIVFNGAMAPNGTLYNSALAEEPISTGMQYTKLFVRHWDTYVTQERSSLWYTTLKGSRGNYTMGKLVNALNGTGLESPVPVTGGTEQYAISKYGIAFISKDPKLSQANVTKSDVYYLPLKTFTEKAPKPEMVDTGDLVGASTSLSFSPAGPSLLFARMKDITYESDKNRIMVVGDVTEHLNATEYFKSDDGVGLWDRSADTVMWSADGKTIYIAAQDYARNRMFSTPADPNVKTLPCLIHKDGSVTDAHPLASGKILVSSASFVDNSRFEWVDPVAAAASNASAGISLISANLKDGSPWGLNASRQVSEIWFPGGGPGDYLVQAWVIKPSFFKENETYPLAFYIHGGPQPETADSWSTRWNMMVFAEQGYVVVAFNPTGSFSFGQWYVDAIQNNWGGSPYLDLVEGYKYIEKNLKYVDLDRAMALGASYGGYMVNLIQGMPLGRKFKALFTHDGSFNTLSQYASEELWFMQHDFNGTLWNNWDNYARYNPANHTDNWATPHLIVHNELDYRLPIAEGLSAFNVLQERGVESKMLIFPDENHWVLKPENSLVWHKTVLDWLNTRVGLKAYSEEDDEAYRGTLMNGPWIS